jgi:hypothetical protein
MRSASVSRVFAAPAAPVQSLVTQSRAATAIRKGTAVAEALIRSGRR